MRWRNSCSSWANSAAWRSLPPTLSVSPSSAFFASSPYPVWFVRCICSVPFSAVAGEYIYAGRWPASVPSHGRCSEIRHQKFTKFLNAQAVSDRIITYKSYSGKTAAEYLLYYSMGQDTITFYSCWYNGKYQFNRFCHLLSYLLPCLLIYCLHVTPSPHHGYQPMPMNAKRRFDLDG